MTNGMGLTDDISGTTNKYYKVKQAKLEVMPYKGGQAKSLMPIMIDYCIDYYTTFNKELNASLDKLNQTMEAKLQALDQVFVESVLYEADEQKVTSATETDKTNVKPTVNIDKSTVARGNDGKKIQSGNSMDVVKWLSRSVQQYSAGVLNATRDRNYEYLKIIKALTPANVKKADKEASNNTQNTQQTETSNNQQNQQTQQ